MDLINVIEECILSTVPRHGIHGYPIMVAFTQFFFYPQMNVSHSYRAVMNFSLKCLWFFESDHLLHSELSPAVECSNP